MEHFTRRRFLGWGMTGAAATLSGAWLAGARLFAAESKVARLKARPGKPTKAAKTGLHELGLEKGKDGMLSVPAGYKPGTPAPLLVMLHGALGRDDGYDIFSKIAAESGIVVLTPDSRGRTWDLMLGGFGPDIAFLDRAVAYAFERVNVNPRKLAIAGFSDGASYALSVGLANGDLFSHILAFSPGYMMPPSRVGKPRVFVSHGVRDEILPVSSSRDRIVPQLKREGYDVKYKEFPGIHTIQPDLAREAFGWFVR